jgi:hypothetical protein
MIHPAHSPPNVLSPTNKALISTAFPLLYLLHNSNAKYLDKVLAVLSKTDGRDKSCKIIQYLCKLALAINQEKYKPLIGTLVKQLSSARRVMRLGKFLKLVNNTNDALDEPRGWKRHVALVSAGVGAIGDLGDDACWASDMGILPPWVRRKCGHRVNTEDNIAFLDW